MPRRSSDCRAINNTHAPVGSRGQAKGYNVTPSQQGAIAVFNSLPQQQAEPTEANVENQQQQGWAARFYANQQPVPTPRVELAVQSVSRPVLL